MEIFWKMIQDIKDTFASTEEHKVDSNEPSPEVLEKVDRLLEVFRHKDIITVYSIEHSFSAFASRDYLELILVINHHKVLSSEEDIKKIELKVGNLFIYEDQWKRLSSRMKTLFVPVEVDLRCK